MKFSVLGSGSKGNSVYVESGKTAILIDAGFSGKELERRLQTIDRTLEKVNGICITHEHHDHISGAGVVSRRCKIPLFANEGTFIAANERIGKVFKREIFETGESFEIGDLKIRSFRLSHDSADPVGYVITNGIKSLGYCTDTGKVSHLITTRLRKCNGLILEFNHNLELLKNGPYPLQLQQRVRSSRGHLCNEDAARFLAELIDDQLDCVIQAHLSDKNNTVELARKAAFDYVAEWGSTELIHARQEQALPLIEL